MLCNADKAVPRGKFTYKYIKIIDNMYNINTDIYNITLCLCKFIYLM